MIDATLATYTFFALLALVFILVGLFLHGRYRLKKLKESAYLDRVTGALTENGFLRKTKTVSEKITQFAVVSMEVPELAQIGQNFGVSSRERTLKYLCDVLKAQHGNDLPIARTGEDTFCFLLKNRKTEEICAKLDTVCSAINRFNENKTAPYPLNPVFGIYLPANNEEDLRDILGKAALARLGGQDGKRCRFYDSERWEKENWEREMAEAMDRAQQIGELVLFLHPKIRLSDQRIVGAEALIRWRHPQRGLLSPDMFLPIAERFNKTELIDRLVFEEVCRMLSRLKKYGRELCQISVNLSRASVNRPDLAAFCAAVCQKYDVSPAQIEFEIKESLLLENLEKSRAVIEALHAEGFRCAVDNFGADFSSLHLLGELNIDTVKLDHSFFSGDNNNRRGRYIVESILRLATQLHIFTVGEGIENYGQVQYLQQAACDFVQGYYFFKPMFVERFESEVYAETTLKYVSIDAPDQNSRHVHPKRPSKSVVLFSYYPQEDVIEFSDPFSPVLGEQLRFENALALFRTTDLIHENDREDFLQLLERCQRESGWVENTLRFYLNEGRYEWLELRMHQDDRSENGTISGTFTNMSGWKDEVNRWKEKATRDALTGLYNREYFEQNASSALDHGTHTSAAILFIDVDDFKRVNDTYGHMFGDDVLCYMAKQILGVFRHTDIIARYGGDEFVVFAPSIEKSVLVDRLKRLCSTFQYPYRSAEIEYKISGSIGAAIFPQDGGDYETLLDHADCALYEAKSRGKNQYVIYEPYMEGKGK